MDITQSGGKLLSVLQNLNIFVSLRTLFSAGFNVKSVHNINK